MKTIFPIVAGVVLSTMVSMGQSGSLFTNKVRQYQLPTPPGGDVGWDVPGTIPSTGTAQSPLAINPGGARFELWTIKSTPYTEYKLDTKYVGTFVPIAQVAIRSEDPYATIPRTRADRPFWVDVSVSGLLTGASDPTASKGVTYLHYIQSYGTTGTGVEANFDRSLATQTENRTLDGSGSTTITKTYPFLMTNLTGTPQTKVRGEERFTIKSLDDYQVPPTQLASQFIQIWPVADGSIAGITMNQMIRFALPDVSLTMNDVYPSSATYAQIYQGPVASNKIGIVVPGSSLVVNNTAPQSRVLTLKNWDKIFDADGQWTLELVTSTPFGVERLAYVTFNLDRTIQFNGNVTTIE